MKLARYDGGKIGVIRDGAVHDVSAACGVDPAEWPPVGIVRVIRDFARLRPGIEKAASAVPGIPLERVRLETPIPWPNKLLALPANFAKHSAEMGGGTPPAPESGFFMKANSSLSGAGDAIVVPNLPGREVHHECELAIIVGRGGRRIPAASALDHIFGYACLMDITVRGKGERVMRKSYDTFTPVGPWITTADEVGDPRDLEMRLWVNGTLRQHARASEMLVGIADAIALCSSVATLEPGDIIAGGTMAGVGPIAPGDRVRIAIDRVGEMTLAVRGEAA